MVKLEILRGMGADILRVQTPGGLE